MKDVSNIKSIPSAEATGGAGYIFEYRMETLFAVLMLCESSLVIFPQKKIVRIKLQTNEERYCTDDFQLILKDDSNSESKVLVQVKKTFELCRSNSDFNESIVKAWEDYRNINLFNS